MLKSDKELLCALSTLEAKTPETCRAETFSLGFARKRSYINVEPLLPGEVAAFNAIVDSSDPLPSWPAVMRARTLTWLAMRICNAFGSVALLSLILIGGSSFGAGVARALDARTLDQNATPSEAFRFGFNAYKKGDKTTAVQALTYAAEKGHAMAQWKLGRMYAEGDGLVKNDAKAFEFFSEVADAHADDNPDTPNARFVANAFVALGSYYRDGIPNSTVQPDFNRAKQMFTYAASYFGDSDAQLNLARMYYDGEGGDRDARQAARWAKLAADKGNVNAQALLGHMLFEGDGVTRQPVVGLMFLTIARDRAKPLDPWVQDLQEQAFSLATETERRTALAMAEDWMGKNTAGGQ